MKYRSKEYKWFEIMFEDGKPIQVHLYKNSPYDWGSNRDKVTTFWDNELLTEKPL